MSDSTPPLGTAPAASEHCGKVAVNLVPRLGMAYACVLTAGHNGECAPGGSCVLHGPYIGKPGTTPSCPKCTLTPRVTTTSEGTRGEVHGVPFETWRAVAAGAEEPDGADERAAIQKNMEWHERNIHGKWAEFLAFHDRAEIMNVIHGLRNSERMIGRHRTELQSLDALATRRMRIAELETQLATERFTITLLEKQVAMFAERSRSWERECATLQQPHEDVHGVTWLLIRDGYVLLEKCPKKARVLGVGEWFVPGGKLEPGETPAEALMREVREEWGTRVESFDPLPIVEGSAVPPGPRGLFLMRPFLVTVRDAPPARSGDGVELRWAPISEALASPVPQVRMMVAAAVSSQQHAEQDARVGELTEQVERFAHALVRIRGLITLMGTGHGDSCADHENCTCGTDTLRKIIECIEAASSAPSGAQPPTTT